MIRLRPLRADDRSAIADWPPYPEEFTDLDYALREHGWLTEFGGRADARLYAAEAEGEVLAFTILARTAVGEAEFRIALHPDRLGRGLGGTITSLTLARGFGELALTRIHLVVRKTNPRAFRLYQGLGFTLRGEYNMAVNHRPTQFLLMDIHRPPLESGSDTTTTGPS